MSLIEKLKQAVDAKELEQQAEKTKLAEAEALHKQRKDQAAVFQKESGISDLVSTVCGLLSKTRFPDAYSITTGYLTVKQQMEEIDSVFDGMIFNYKGLYNYMGIRDGYSEEYVSIATRPSGEIVFYSQERTLIPESDWRNDKDILERTLERALDTPGSIRKEPTPSQYPIRMPLVPGL